MDEVQRIDTHRGRKGEKKAEAIDRDGLGKMVNDD
jgi:hypothetical protein